ncbi:hypothetical protein [Segnochrobactrum spirostomi]|uniref:Sulfotransferase n=1 Tax=Segnochrobactrum spirostomi TaxID=2608987 RepID=A0A6A7YCZ7_9HYPH|nr:hypothetical protein [Segnochrobactrum spirostomi]MQT15279.1 sulfotransferase [Segnochrobactrum spirostomi]
MENTLVTESPLFTFNQDSKNSDPAKTLLVLGVARTGTSLVSGMLRELGVFMGARAHGLKHEQDFILPDDDYSTIIEKIERMNSEHQIWGWKSPMSLFFYQKFIHHLRNPHIIITFRNPLSAALSAAKYNNTPLEVALSDYNDVMSSVYALIERSYFPTALFNFEAAQRDIEGAVDGLARFLDMGEEMRGAKAGAYRFFNADGGYRAVSEESNIESSMLRRMEYDDLNDSVRISARRIPGEIERYKSMTIHLIRDCATSLEILAMKPEDLLQNGELAKNSKIIEIMNNYDGFDEICSVARNEFVVRGIDYLETSDKNNEEDIEKRKIFFNSNKDMYHRLMSSYYNCKAIFRDACRLRSTLQMLMDRKMR